MNKHLEKYLVKKYPEIFVDYGGDMRRTCMAWGMSHGDGWFFLIDALCSSIQNHIDNPQYVYKKTFKVYCIRTWNWIARTLRLPYRWFYYRGEQMELGPKMPQVVARQVKEKFGGLRFYYDGGDDEIRGMVRLAESLSYRICEECGVMNELVNRNGGGWIRTTCPCCVEPHLKEDHLENRRTEMVELFNKIRREEIEKELEAFNKTAETPVSPQTKQNDRKKQAVQQDPSCKK